LSSSETISAGVMVLIVGPYSIVSMTRLWFV
jgi:hypothetical protein